MISFLVRLLARKGIYLSRNPNEKYFPLFVETINSEIIKNSDGILHIGAHTGEEAKTYWESNKPVIWVEAVPSIFNELERNIRNYPNQIPLNYALGDVQGELISFNVTNNEGSSSSIYEFSENGKSLGVQISNKLNLVMHRLDKVLTHKESKMHNHWVIDVQGAELLVLQGSGELIKDCNSMFVEVSTWKIYEGGVLWDQLLEFLKLKGFYPLWMPHDNFHGNMIFLRKIPNSAQD
jgi:FkbM family methyltransferase